MTSPVVPTTVRRLLPLFLLVSVFLLFHGHDEPGGGFVGGLVAGTGFVLYALSYGVPTTRRLMRVDPRTLVAAGLLTALVAGLVPLLAGRAFLTGLWLSVGGAEFGTPQLFDVGVYLIVVGMVLMMVFALAEE